MKFIKRFENVEINKIDYNKEINEKEFLFLLKKHCKDFNPHDTPLLRGDRKLNENFYYLNSKNRKLGLKKFSSTIPPFHIHFLSSEKWDGLPKKNQSSDFVISDAGNLSGMYGKKYRIIPFDGGKFSCYHSYVGAYNDKIMEDLKSIERLGHLNSDLYEFHNIHYNHTLNIENIINNLNNLFKDKSKVLEFCKNNTTFNGCVILDMYNITNKNKINFKEYMEDAFSPKSYTINDYENVVNDNENIVGWSDTPFLLIDYNYSKILFK